MANLYSAENELSYGKRITWSAIFAGTFVAIGVELLLALLGMAIGLSTLSASTGG